MAYLNIYSISNYVLTLFLYIKGRSSFAFLLTFIEIFIHQLLGSYYLGFESGFNVVYMCLFFLVFTFFQKWSIRFILSLTLIFVIYIVYANKHYLAGEYSNKQDIFFYLNTLSSSIFMIVYGALATVSSSKKLADLAYLVHHDFLTGLYNRKYFEEKIIQNINENEKTIIAICDIDNFKKINDNYGHDIGDAILKSVASAIEYEVLEHNGTVARWGGEEFIIKINSNKLENALECLNSIKNQVLKQELKKYDLKPTITIGAVFIENPKVEKFEEYFKLADEELYKGKESGKNIVKVKKYNF